MSPSYLLVFFMLCGLALMGGSRSRVQEQLPFPEQWSTSKEGPTIAQSVYSLAQPAKRLPEGATNIVINVLDDIGPALPDILGGPIHTPPVAVVYFDREGFKFNGSIDRVHMRCHQ